MKSIFFDEGKVKNYIMEKLLNPKKRIISENIDKAKIEYILDNMEQIFIDKDWTIEDVLKFASENNLKLNQREIDYIQLINQI